MAALLRLPKLEHLLAVLDFSLDHGRALQTFDKRSLGYIIALVTTLAHEVFVDLQATGRSERNIGDVLDECRDYLRELLSQPQQDKTPPRPEVSEAPRAAPRAATGETEVAASLPSLTIDFCMEVRESLAVIGPCLDELKRATDPLPILNDLFRAFHTIKGGARLMRARRMEVVAQHMESMLDEVRNARPCRVAPLVPALLAGKNQLEELVQEVTSSRGRTSEPSAVPSVLLAVPSRTEAVIIRNYLKCLGLEPLATVGSCAEALDAVRTLRPDTVLADLHLKDRSGMYLAEQLHDEFKTKPIGFVLIATEEESKGFGALRSSGEACVLHKPFGLEQLTAALRVVTQRKARADFGSLKVLLVDDSTTMRLNERRVLQGLGVKQIVEARDGTQAVALLAKEQIDLSVTDYNMPNMDGLQLLVYLRENAATVAIPVVMVTGEADPAKRAALTQLGIAGFCDKSFKPEVVRPFLEQLVR